MVCCYSLSSITQCWRSVREDHHILHTGWDIECTQDGGWRRGENTDQPVCVCVGAVMHGLLVESWAHNPEDTGSDPRAGG